MDEWYKSIYAEHKESVFGRALKLLKNRGEAEDLTHEVFLNVIRKNDYDSTRGSVIAYLMIKTEGLARDRWRRMRSRKQLNGDEVDVFEVDIPDAQRDVLSRIGDHQEALLAWKKLRPAEERVLRLFFFRDLNFAEIAEQLDISPVTVKNHYVRGMERLRKHFFGPLKAEWPGRIKVSRAPSPKGPNMGV